MKEPHKIIFLVTEDWYFVSHRLPLACAAKEAGYEVVIVTQVTSHEEVILQAGLSIDPIKFSRSHGKPWQDLTTIYSIFKAYKKHQPDIVHHVSIKPTLYGSIAAFLARVPVVVNALTGLGFVFSSHQIKAKLLRSIIKPFLKLIFSRKNTWLIVQNPDDQQTLENDQLIDHSRLALIKGSGVDSKKFRSELRIPSGQPIVMLAARMLWDKGVGEFVTAAQKLKKAGCEARFVLVGDTDRENPACISQQQLIEWQSSGYIEWWGRKEDMAVVLSQATIVCLPSYREGLPKVLIEAAACGKPIITTDAPGCREIVKQGENGLLVPVRDTHAVADAIETLLSDSEMRAEMGKRGRRLVEQEFTIEKVVEQTLRLYSSALEHHSG